MRVNATANVLSLMLFGFCSTAAYSQTQPTSAETIRIKIQEILASLPAAGSAADQVWREQANHLRARLSSFDTGDGVAAAVERSAELEALLRSLATSTNAPLRAAVDKLNEAAATIEANEPVLAFGKRVARLDRLVNARGFPATHSDVVAGLEPLARVAGKIEANESVVKLKSHGDVIAAILAADTSLTGNRSDVLVTAQKLLPLLERLETADPVTAIKRRAASTTAVIDTFVLGKPLAKAEDVQSALTDLSNKIAAAATPLVPRVHIIDAFYGDLTPKAAKSRMCDATAAMVHQCERKTKCNIPASTTDLCGFDPVPQASEAIKGLRVKYQCVAGTDRIWGEIAGTPGKLVAGIPAQTNVMRKSTQELACLVPES